MVATPTHLLIHTCTIQRATVTADATGGPSHSYSNLATGVACRAQPQIGGEGVQAGGRRRQPRAQIFVDGAQDVTEADRVTSIVADGIASTEVFKITSVRDNQGIGVLRRLDCEGVKP